MNRFQFAIAAVALAATSASFAQSAEEAVPAWVNGEAVQPAINQSKPMTAVAQVKQDAQRAQAVIVTGKSSGLTRADVQAEFFAARASGEINSFDNEPYFHNVSTNAPAGVASAR
jgi:hypothetical protein